MDRLKLLKTFVSVIETGSFTAASKALGMPRSSVSTAIKDLEALLGVRLLHRTTRHVTPTDDGSAFFGRCSDLLNDYDTLEEMFSTSRRQPRGKLKINVPSRIGRLIIIPRLPEFLEAYPGIDLDFGMSDRRIDQIAEGVDCVIRVGTLSDSALISKKIGDISLINCVSPGYLETYGTPEHLADLDAHYAVNYVSPRSGRDEQWEYLEKRTLRRRAMKCRISVTNAEGYIAACVAGLGLIQVPEYDVRSLISSGALREVMSDYRPEPMTLSLLYPHRLHLSLKLSVFVDWVTKILQDAIFGLPQKTTATDSSGAS